MNNIAVILGAGSGSRMKADKSKLLLEIGGMTVIERTVLTFINHPMVDEVIVVCRESDFEAFENVLSRYDISYCFGGETRQESVKNTVETIDDCDLLIIHDGARPLVTDKEISDTISKARESLAAAVGVPVKDTIKIVDDSLKIIDTPKRSSLISIRTPQIFKFSLYTAALSLANEQNRDFTDDCQLIENYGAEVFTVIGDYGNIKITTPEDLPTAESIIKMRGKEQ
ncbi:MAG: 2-C-methyl-D-erythritol 4-phosphate cytidylyltransferase [Clostridiales bacterium]|nr:2-C-methyl-D-erythritol 4-phosphate cytidylyltransferase [Clostridiales bacterium]